MPSPLSPSERIFVGLDTPDIDKAARIAKSLVGTVGGVKIGKELFTAQGPDGVRVAAGGAPLFLDLKFHDIPNTVAGAIRAAVHLRPRIVNVHASGGIYLNGALLHSSDKNKKEAFEAINPEDILAKVLEMPVSSWRFKTESERVRHIGPTAQDFEAAFSLGNDDRYINSGDADGVALAAIQGLNEKLERKDATIAVQDQRIAELEARLAALEEAIAKE